MEETRTTGPGQGGVHSQIGVEPSKGDGMSGKYDAGQTGSGSEGGAVESAKQRAGEMADQARNQANEVSDQARNQAHEAADQVRNRVNEATGEARNRMDDVRGRAEEMVGEARNRATGILDQAENSQPVRMARDNPLPALGIAFAAGFLLAGSSDPNGKMGAAKRQIRGAVMGGVSAALAQEMRGMVGMQGGQGGGGLLESLLGGGQGGGQQGPQGAGSRG